MFLHTYLMKYSTVLLCAATLISDTPNLAVIGQIYFAKVVQHLLTKLRHKITLSFKTLFILLLFSTKVFVTKTIIIKRSIICALSLLRLGKPNTLHQHTLQFCEVPSHAHFLTQHISNKKKKENLH